MRIAVVQSNTTIGAFDAIDALIDRTMASLQDKQVDLVVLPDFFWIGGRAGEFAIRQEILTRSEQRLQDAAARYAGGPALLVTTPRAHTEPVGKGVHHAALLLHHGDIRTVQHQHAVPSIGVCNDHCFFDPGPSLPPFTLVDTRIGIAIGNDLWNEATSSGRKAFAMAPAVSSMKEADLLLHIDADPWFDARPNERWTHIRTLARDHACPILHVNAVGTTQSVIYDGRSMMLSSNGTLRQRGARFANDLLIVDTEASTPTTPIAISGDPIDETLDALIYALRDNVHKSGFQDVVLGLSGGIDSALVAAIAVEALGASHVYGVALPSRYSSDHSLKDAADLAHALRMPYQEISIEETHVALLHTLAPSFAGTTPSTAEENLQARARGILLMGLANKFNRLLLATSNKSESAVGYSTLYGDMCGAFSPIIDVPKQMVYALSRRYNERKGFAAIPENTLTKAPSAELRPDQKDQDSLPPYDVLDAILHAVVIEEKSPQSLLEAGFSASDIRRTLSLLYRGGYKRQQAPPGFKISRQALTIGRDFPPIGDFSSLNLPKTHGA